MYAMFVDCTFLLTVHGLVIVMKTSYAHCHTIIHVIHIQSYIYNHAIMLHARKGSIVHIQCASAHGVYLGVGVLIPACNRIAYGSSASNQHELKQTQSCWMTMVTTCIWSFGHNMMRTLSYNHTNIHKQSCSDA